MLQVHIHRIIQEQSKFLLCQSIAGRANLLLFICLGKHKAQTPPPPEFILILCWARINTDFEQVTALDTKLCHLFTNRLSGDSVHLCFSSAGQAMAQLGDSLTTVTTGKGLTHYQSHSDGDTTDVGINSIYREKCDSKQKNRFITQITRYMIKKG